MEENHSEPSPIGEQAISKDLLEEVYQRLRAIAQFQMNNERAGHTLSATALVHEAYLKLASPRENAWKNKAHFYAAAVEAMRRILTDHARARARHKRGGGCGRVDFDAAATLAIQNTEESPDFIAIDEAICRLRDKDLRMAEVVRLRYFAGLSIAETASILNVSEKTVQNDWTFAKAWLAKELDRAG